MTTDRDDRRLRQYLLGVLPDEQCAVIEEEYFVNDEALDRVWAVEHDLIDGYLSDRLSPAERERFDRHYLATSVHRHRVATARQLRSLAAGEGFVRQETRSWKSVMSILQRLLPQPSAWKMAVATILLLMAIGGAWLVRVRLARQGETAATVTTRPPQRPGPEAPSATSPGRFPVLLAISLSPAGVRSAEDAPPVRIPPGTDRVIVHLESDGARAPFIGGRAIVRTVSGREVWTGPATATSPQPPPAFAQLDIPADRLSPDDYIVSLFESAASGREVEGLRYFLRIRAR